MMGNRDQIYPCALKTEKKPKKQEHVKQQFLEVTQKDNKVNPKIDPN